MKLNSRPRLYISYYSEIKGESMPAFFRFDENGTNLHTEIIAGITTFLAMMYIIVVNPAIISASGMNSSAVLTATVLVSALSSVAMGLFANNPIALAPGMGINAFFTYSLVLGLGMRWETALGAVFWSGVIFILLSVFNVRTYIVEAIPAPIRYAVAAGIGLFISLIGLKNGGFISSNPATLIGLGQWSYTMLTFTVGLFLTSLLVAGRIKGALILGIVMTTLLSFPIGRWYAADSAPLVVYQGLFSAPDFSLIFKLDFTGSLKIALWPVVFAFLFTDMFDSLSTFIGVAEAGNIKDAQGQPRNIKQSLIVDGFSTMISGLLGTSSGTSYIESATGIEEGGRTGLTAVVAGLLFLPFMFFSPLSWTFLKLALGRWREIPPMLLLIDAGAIGSMLI